MLTVARIYLAIAAVLLALVGFTALISPQTLLTAFDLAAQSEKGIAEIRSLYAGVFLSWAITIGVALAAPRRTRMLLLSLGLTMAAIAVMRVISLIADYEPEFNVPALIGEALIALACFVLYRGPRRTRNAGGITFDLYKT